MNSTKSEPFAQALINDAGIRVPLIGGPMYPCSNLELVAAVSEAGALGVVQPVTLTFVEGFEFRKGLQKIRELTQQPIAMNVLIEKSSRRYHQKMMQWLDIALEEDVRFFITSLGNPDWVVKRVREVSGIVYHDATERQWAQKALDAGVNGLIAVNQRAGGHLGSYSKEALLDQIGDLGLPVVCAGGIGNARQYLEAMQLGYAGCQLGTRFIASTECSASDVYKQAIIAADESDIVASERITGVPVSLINNDTIKNAGLKAGRFSRWMLKDNKRKHWMRLFYTLRSAFELRSTLQNRKGAKDVWQAGKSVDGISSIETVDKIISDFEIMLNRMPVNNN